MNRKLDNVLFVVGLIVIALVLLFVTDAYSANVTDNNRGTNGQILVNNGTGQGHQGTWTKPEDLPAIVDLNKALNTEIDNRVFGDKTLQSNLDTEISKRAEADDGLLSNINTVNDDLKTEVDDRTNGDKTLQNNIDVEQFDRIKMGNVLQDNINVVDTNSQSRDNTLQTNINNEATTRGNADTKLQNNINSVNSRVDDVSNRVSKLERTQYVVKTELKFIREKHLEVGAYAAYNVGRNTCSEVGLNIVIPIGESYLDRENRKINSRLTALEQKVGTAAVIEKTVDTKGKIKSIRITEGQLVVGEQF